MGAYFGTDGYRGEANVTLTGERAFRMGRFLGWYLLSQNATHKPRVVMGKDTRQSGDMLEAALTAGLTASGADVYLLRVTTTPSLAFLCRDGGFDMGIMISASHNPFYDNGIKLVDAGGEKVGDAVISAIEAYLKGIRAGDDIPMGDLPYATREHIGTCVEYRTGGSRYRDYLTTISPHTYPGVKVGLDCANGSTCHIAEEIYRALGAEVYPIHNTPNGVNINHNCGSTHIESLISLVRERGLDVGFAFDGDGDRLICVNHLGEVVDGDGILYITSKHLLVKNQLTHHTIVATVMSNGGLIQSLRQQGIGVEQTPVGDRYVYQAMKEGGYVLGGEQSGHIIFSRYAKTGDGLLTSRMLMDIMQETGRSLRELGEGYIPLCQHHIHFPTGCAVSLSKDPLIGEMVEGALADLGDGGRVLMRPSGTEPVLRILLEGTVPSLVQQAANRVYDILREREKVCAESLGVRE